jgi:hypothetical protein
MPRARGLKAREMRIFLFWNLLVASGALVIAMLLAIRCHRLRRTDWRAAVEYAWAVVPWLTVALCAAPVVHRFFAAE